MMVSKRYSPDRVGTFDAPLSDHLLDPTAGMRANEASLAQVVRGPAFDTGSRSLSRAGEFAPTTRFSAYGLRRSLRTEPQGSDGR
jgi:hypothetical protein